MAGQSSLTVSSELHVEPRAPSRALIRAQVAVPVRADPIALSGRATSAQALVVIATSCLRQIALNQAGVREASGEAVHQMRVGLRRLRAVLSLFKSVLGRGEFVGMKREVGWL